MTPCVSPHAQRLRLLITCAVMALALPACLDSDPAGPGSESAPLHSHLGSGFFYVDAVVQSSNSGLCNPVGHIVNLYNGNTGKSYSAPVIGNTAHVPVPISDAGSGFIAFYRPISAEIGGLRRAPFGGFAPDTTYEASTCVSSIYAPGNSNSTIPLTPPNFLFALDNYAFNVNGNLTLSPAMFVNPSSVVRTALNIELVDEEGDPDTGATGNLGYLLQPFGAETGPFPCPPDASDPELCEFDPALLYGLGTVVNSGGGQQAVNFASVVGLGGGSAYAVEVANNDNSRRWLGACLKGETAEACKLASTSELARTYHVEDSSADAQGGPEILFGHGGFIVDGGVVSSHFLSWTTTVGEGLVAHKRTLNPDGSARPDDVLLDCRLNTGCTKVSRGQVVRASGFCYEQDGDVYCQSEVVVDVKSVEVVDFGFQTFKFGTRPRNATPANAADDTEIRRADKDDEGGTWKLIG